MSTRVVRWDDESFESQHGDGGYGGFHAAAAAAASGDDDAELHLAAGRPDPDVSADDGELGETVLAISILSSSTLQLGACVYTSSTATITAIHDFRESNSGAVQAAAAPWASRLASFTLS